MYSLGKLKCVLIFYSSLYECLSAIATGVVMLCSLIDNTSVSEEHIASIFMASFLWIFGVTFVSVFICFHIS